MTDPLKDRQARIKVSWNVQLMAEDIALQGWEIGQLAFKAKVTPATISRFLHGRSQTVKTARSIAKALGYRTPARYVIRRQKQVA